MTGHVATVVDSWIYIDGGELSFLNNGTPVYTFCKAMSGTMYACTKYPLFSEHDPFYRPITKLDKLQRQALFYFQTVRLH